MGQRLIGVLLATLLLSGALFVVARALGQRQNFLSPPESVGPWKRTSQGVPPPSDRERDSPAIAVYSVYTYGQQQAPVFVSYARAANLNTFRDPARYIVDHDGRVPVYGRETYGAKGKAATYVIEIVYGRNNNAILAHWVQSPGEEPHADVVSMGVKAGLTLARRKVLYVCDVWMPIRSDTSGYQAKLILQQFEEILSKQIKATAP